VIQIKQNGVWSDLPGTHTPTLAEAIDFVAQLGSPDVRVNPLLVAAAELSAELRAPAPVQGVPAVLNPGDELSLRESDPGGWVHVLINGNLHNRFREYALAIKYVQRTFGWSEPELLSLFRPYKDDYDTRF
jgi:hypothetical protein